MYARLTWTELRATPPPFINVSLSVAATAPSSSRAPASSRPSPRFPSFPRNFRRAATYYFGPGRLIHIVGLEIRMNVEGFQSDRARRRRCTSHENVTQIFKKNHAVYWRNVYKSLTVKISLTYRIMHYTNSLSFYLAINIRAYSNIFYSNSICSNIIIRILII